MVTWTKVTTRLPATQGFPTELQAIDVNADGFDDLVVARLLFPLENRALPVQVLVNNQSGGLVDATASIFPGGAPTHIHPREMVAADFNGDGRPDLFTADHGYDAPPFPGAPNGLLLSGPGGSFVNARASLPSVIDFTHSATPADVDRDGDTDLYVGNLASGQTQIGPYVLLNSGSGVFSRAATGMLPAAVESSGVHYTTSLFLDVDRDGDPDLFLGSDAAATSQVLLNNGLGQFTAQPHPSIPVGGFGPAQTITVDAQARDFDGDGYLDLILSQTGQTPFYVGRYIQILVNNHDGTFHDETASRLPQSNFAGAGWSNYSHLVDLNGDGVEDLALEVVGGETGDYTARFYLNDGTGHFVSAQSAGPSIQSFWETVDLNRDGRLEFAVIDGAGINIYTGIGGINVNDPNRLVDDRYYNATNHDVLVAQLDPDDHFNANGWREGRKPNAFFDVREYLLLNPDVAAAGINPLEHYDQRGWREGRDPGLDFDTTFYLNRHPDVAQAGINPLTHYLTTGQAEGRAIGGFDRLEYIASYTDLMNAFGANGDSGATHYIQAGRFEGRSVTFDGLEYIASYADLSNAFGANDDAGAAHYITNGRFEGRQDTFDGLEYIASYSDLIAAFGTNRDAGTTHYIQHGRFEGRADTFDPEQYLNNYADLRAAFGHDVKAATEHFIEHGHAEGRTDDVFGF